MAAVSSSSAGPARGKFTFFLRSKEYVFYEFLRYMHGEAIGEAACLRDSAC